MESEKNRKKVFTFSGKTDIVTYSQVERQRISILTSPKATYVVWQVAHNREGGLEFN